MVQFYPWIKFYFLCFGYGNLMIISLKQRKKNLNNNISTEEMHAKNERERPLQTVAGLDA